jgi:hypothetical protein
VRNISCRVRLCGKEKVDNKSLLNKPCDLVESTTVMTGSWANLCCTYMVQVHSFNVFIP